MDRKVERQEWVRALAAFTDRNAGRRTIVEVDGDEIGAQRGESGLPLRGIAYDSRDRRVEIMLGEQADVERRITRSIEGVISIDLNADEAGRDRALRVAYDGGQTVLRFVAPSSG